MSQATSFVHTPSQLDGGDLRHEWYMSTGSNWHLISGGAKESEQVFPRSRTLYRSIPAEAHLTKMFAARVRTISRQEQSDQLLRWFTQAQLTRIEHEFAWPTNRAVHVPDIPPDVLFEVADGKDLESCFFKTLERLKKELLQDSRVEGLSVSKLNDPEGAELRIYFEVQTTGLSYQDRRNIRTKLETIIDQVVEGVVDDEQFIAIRVIFGVTVKQELEG